MDQTDLANATDDAALEDISGYLPHLTTLQLPLEWIKVTNTSLISIGRNCPLLEKCEVAAKIDFEALFEEVDGVAWPKLRTLRLRHVDPFGRRRA